MSELQDASKAVDEVFRLFRDYGEKDYLGEAISKTAHSLQCGMLAEKEGYPKEVVVGAFLHDIGHLVGEDRHLVSMVTDHAKLGIADHDIVGGDFLKKLGFPDTVCDIVRGHVQAKRYLVLKDNDYYKKLTSASKMTLQHQGGPMTSEEAREFENSRRFDMLLCMRRWDESGKEVDIELELLEKYQKLCLDVLMCNSS